MPREPPINTEPSTSPPPANSSSIPNNLHDENSDSMAVPSASSGDGENSFQTISPPSSPEGWVIRLQNPDQWSQSRITHIKSIKFTGRTSYVNVIKKSRSVLLLRCATWSDDRRKRKIGKIARGHYSSQ